MHHPAWNLLFHNPEFWAHLTKLQMCCLLGTCKEFKTSIPERDVCLRIFKNASMKKVDLFHLFPLTVYDVLKIRSPVKFTDAFRIAERKAGGFPYCMSLIREKGWRLWCKRDKHRTECKKKIEDLLRSNGTVPFPYDHLTLEKLADRSISRAVVWRYTWRTQSDTAQQYDFHYYRVLMAIQKAHGFWYKGIHKDTHTAIGTINAAMTDSTTTEYVHVALANAILAIGVVSFHP